MSRPTKRDIKNDTASKCERESCGKIIWQDEAYFHEYYNDLELTDFDEDIIYCERCARELFSREEFEQGVKKEYNFSGI